MSASDGLLVADGMTRRFGGLVAVDSASFVLQRGEIHGLIGPNGAGKSTLIALISGFLRPHAGRVRFDASDITTRSPSRVARLGLARTFQAATPLNGLTVRENLLVGLHSSFRTTTLEVLLRLPRMRRERRELNTRADELLQEYALTDVADRQAQSLPFGQLRFLDVARAVARRPSALLLDEPAAGLNPVETETLASIVRRLADSGTSVLLVDHDVPFLFGLCDRVTAMNFGKVIADGTPDQIYENAAVREAYLGSGREGGGT